MSTEAHHADQRKVAHQTVRVAQPVEQQPSPLADRVVASGLAELEHRQRRIAGPLTLVFLGYYAVFLLLTALAPELLRLRLFWHLSFGYLLAWSVFVVTGVASAIYLKLAHDRIDPLVDRIRQHLGLGDDDAGDEHGEAAYR
ncbi:MAG TPA: DUF485 domain-containing protein [Actinomycetes bacterium]